MHSLVHIQTADGAKLTNLKETQSIPKVVERTHAFSGANAVANAFIVVAGWIMLSAICTPILGRALYALRLDEPVSPSPRRSLVAPKLARKAASHRRSSRHLWLQRTHSEIEAG